MELIHELSWSASRASTFAECRRRYYFDYYLSWRGWERDGAEERRRTYLLKKLSRMPLLAGDSLHRSLAQWFAGRVVGEEEGPEVVEKRALASLREGYKESRDGLWRQRPGKMTHLAEHHYGEACIDEKSGRAAGYGKRYVERIRTCVRTFFEHPGLEEVRGADPDAYLALEEMGTIELFGTRVFAVPDFALRRASGKIGILDWKTGEPRDEDLFQLATYALYAQERWGASPEDVECTDVYLSSGTDAGALRSKKFTRSELKEAAGRIEGSLAEMRAVHFDAGESVGEAGDFPKIPAGSAAGVCSFCNYRELCGR